jgi:hypothetical protein
MLAHARATHNAHRTWISAVQTSTRGVAVSTLCIALPSLEVAPASIEPHTFLAAVSRTLTCFHLGKSARETGAGLRFACVRSTAAGTARSPCGARRARGLCCRCAVGTDPLGRKGHGVRIGTARPVRVRHHTVDVAAIDGALRECRRGDAGGNNQKEGPQDAHDELRQARSLQACVRLMSGDQRSIWRFRRERSASLRVAASDRVPEFFRPDYAAADRTRPDRRSGSAQLYRSTAVAAPHSPHPTACRMRFR